MTQQLEAMKLALEALENDAMQRTYAGGLRICNAAIALRQAIEQAQKQEPVAYRSRMRNRDGQVITGWVVHLDTTQNPDPRVEIEPLYTSPPPRQPLTDEQILAVARNHYNPYQRAEISFARAIEAAHGIKGEA